jgi:formylglycine-generating enzyme required for sulfatase activity
MKKFLPISLAVILVLALALAGCGGSSGGSGTTYTPGQSKPYTVGSIAFNMNYVPGGLTFPIDNDTTTIGTPTVANAYWIAETDVTSELWSAVYTWATSHGYTFVTGDGHIGSGNTGSPQQPVTTINWREAMIWCNALTEYYYGNSSNCVYYTNATYTTSIRSVDNSSTVTTAYGSEDKPYVNLTAKGFRLPTSNEWELAARYIGPTKPTITPLSTDVISKGGLYWTPGNYASGATADYTTTATSAVAVYGGVSSGVTGTAEVKSKVKGANALGLYDMSGNVWQWCFDWEYIGSDRVIRGGCWSDDDASFLRLCYVNTGYPFSVGDYLGFRPVRTQ